MSDHRRSKKTDEPVEIFLDLNLPGIDGCEVLETIRADPNIRRFPVIIFTGSDACEDIERCYAARANAYLAKPDAPERFRGLVETVERFWHEQVQLPPRS